uniref:Uncharacterized protein n=1 Tax=uncultured organism TaxID=155900 RepID=M1PQH3_9ZZZZ|nr:hypothetical protein FLSS-25_0016 [uncultured organism]
MNQEKTTLEINISKELKSKLKKDHTDVSQYVQELIKKDNESTSSEVISSSEEEMELKGEKEILENLELEKLKEFLKNYRKKNWIEYILNTRGEEAIRSEAKRIAGMKKNEWSEFLNSIEETKKLK